MGGITITNSAQKSYNRCHRLYWYKFIKGLTPKHSSLPLRRGNWLHELLEAHYTGVGWEKQLKALSGPFYSMFEEEREEYGDLPKIVEHIMRSYVYHWREEDSGLTVIDAEKVIEIPLPHGHTYQFKFDAIVEDEWGRWLMEHKSHKTIPRADFRFIDMQTAKYVWGLNELGEYGEITGVLWNYIRTKEPTVPQIMTKTGRLSRRKFDTDVLTYYHAIVDQGLDPHEFRDVLSRLKQHQTFFRRERVPKPKKVIETLVKETVVVADEIERGVRPTRSIDRSCEWCSFRDLCIVQLYGGDAQDVMKRNYRKATKEDYYGYHDEEKVSTR